jgi:hypothetical protein
MNLEKTEDRRIQALSMTSMLPETFRKMPESVIEEKELQRIVDRVTISPQAKALSLKSATRLAGDRPWQILYYEINPSHRPFSAI